MTRHFGIPTAALAAAAMFFVAANAQAVLIDGFGGPQQGPVTANSSTPTASSATVAATETDLTNNQRTITANWISGPLNVEAVVLNGIYSHSQDQGTRGSSQADWTFDAVDLSSGVDIVVEVLFADLPGAFVELTLWDVNNNQSTQSIAIPQVLVGTQTLTVALSNFTPPVDLTQVNQARMVINGAAVTALDVAVDFVRTVPEPATVALIGLGLLGLGRRHIKIRNRAA